MKAPQYIATLATAALGLYSPTADATAARKERSQVYEFAGAPAGLEKITVSAGVTLIPNQANGTVVVRVGSDELPHRADVSVKNAVGKELPVCGYTVQYVVSPATEASQMDPRDDLVIGKPYRAAFPTPKPLKGIEIDYRMEEKDFALLANLPGDGKYILYTRGTVSVPVAGTDCTQTLKIPGFSEGPSYDVFTVVGTKGTSYVYDDARVKEWREGPLVHTKAGAFNPQWNHLVSAQGIMQYEAGEKMGSHFAIMGTGKNPSTPTEPCAQKTDPCDKGVICEPTFFERHYLVGAETAQHENRTIITPSMTSKNVKEIKAGEHLVARYAGIHYNLIMHEVAGNTTQRPDGTLALDERVVTDPRFSAPIVVPMHEDMFAIASVLYGMTAEDKNHNGKIEATEWTCEPIATKVDYVEFVPRGQELEAIAIALPVGMFVGYFLPPLVVSEAGTGGFGAAGSPIQ